LDLTHDTAPDLEPRELLRRYGRDPSRPTWADGQSERPERAAATERSASRRPRTRHQSVCATCGQTAETTFQPDPARPVYCDACFHETRQRRRAATAVTVS
jgi:CxxC-x17-CxxC domain-containing protein